jgi:hypothetical protein
MVRQGNQERAGFLSKPVRRGNNGIRAPMQRALLTTEGFVKNKTVIEGEALVKATSQRSHSSPTELNKP